MGKIFRERVWGKFVCSALVATFLIATTSIGNSNQEIRPAASKRSKSFTCFKFVGGLTVALAAGFYYGGGTGDSEGETFTGTPSEVSPPLNLPLIAEGRSLATFRFSAEGTKPPTAAFFYGEHQKAIAKGINRQALIDEKDSTFRRRLAFLYKTEPHKDEALYVEFEGILFERLPNDRERVRMYLSLSTREAALSRGSLEELKPIWLRIRSDRANRADLDEIEDRQSFSISDLEKGEPVVVSWFPPASSGALGSGQVEAEARFHYDKRSGKIHVAWASTRLEVRSFFVRGGIQAGSAYLEKLEAFSGPVQRKPIFR